MSCSALIRKDESHFNLAQRLVTVLSEELKLNFDDTWLKVSNNTIPQLQKRFRKIRRANNPLINIKKPRTSFSFFTKKCRSKIAEKNPKASFGELSKLVSVAWKGLSDKDRKLYKKMEEDDKVRYNKEKEEILANLETAPCSAEETNVEEVVQNETTSSPSAKKQKTTKTTKTTTSTKSSSKPSKSTSTKSKSSSSNTEKSKTKTKTSSSKSTKTKTPYQLFYKEQQSQLKEKHPDMSLGDMNKNLGVLWKGLTD